MRFIRFVCEMDVHQFQVVSVYSVIFAVVILK